MLGYKLTLKMFRDGKAHGFILSNCSALRKLKQNATRGWPKPSPIDTVATILTWAQHAEKTIACTCWLPLIWGLLLLLDACQYRLQKGRVGELFP